MVAERGITIREARPAEFEAVADLVVEAYDAIAEADDGYLPELRDVAARAAQVPVLVAVDDATGPMRRAGAWGGRSSSAASSSPAPTAGRRSASTPAPR